MFSQIAYILFFRLSHYELIQSNRVFQSLFVVYAEGKIKDLC